MAYNHDKGLCYILKEKKVCFIPVPKNSSTTFRKECPWVYESENFVQNPSVLQENKVVTIIREPLDRFISGYLEILIRTHDCPKTLEKDFYYIKSEPQRFLGFIKEIHKGFFDAHAEPQLFYLTDENNKIIKLDEIWLLKNTNEKMSRLFEKQITKKTNYKPIDDKKNYKDFLNSDPRLVGLIENLYKQDIQFYNKQIEKEK
tara:strand:- start:1226 stop:1831 length:606 start_codon:yes stop_codon:yes gene_type:complete